MSWLIDRNPKNDSIVKFRKKMKKRGKTTPK